MLTVYPVLVQLRGCWPTATGAEYRPLPQAVVEQLRAEGRALLRFLEETAESLGVVFRP